MDQPLDGAFFIMTRFEAFPLTPPEIDEIMDGIHGLIDGGVRDLVFFYYPRNWRAGEIVWTPVAEKIPHLMEKYSSAASAISIDPAALRARLLAEEICIIFLLIEVEEDNLMAYQHSKRSNFLTHKGVDKLHGTERIAAALDFDPAHSVGAGDTQMDTFLQGMGARLARGTDGAGVLPSSRIISARSQNEWCGAPAA